MITTKTKKEIEILREGGRRLARILQKVCDAAQPGVSTLALDRLAESLIFKSEGIPAFKGYRIADATVPYPGSLCVSINDEVVHAIPRRGRILKEGDIVGLDIGMQWPAGQSQLPASFRNKIFGLQSEVTSQSKIAAGDKGQGSGLFTDMAVTVGIGKITSEKERLIRMTQEALDLGIQEVRHGARVGDIGFAVQKHLALYKFGIVRDLAGHGVGYKLHEEPFVPNFGKPGTGPILEAGMVIAIEPMATLGDRRVVLDDDGWTFRTADGSAAAHFEHTVAVTLNGREVLTRF